MNPLRQSLIAQRVVPVLRLPSAELTERALDYLGEAGFGSAEITLTTPQAIALISRFRNRFLIGGFTPGEILAAHREGADIVKVFPASTGGPEHLRAINAVFPDIPLCPTGGVSLENIDSYFAAGAALVGVGNNIIDPKALAAGERAAVVAHARRFLR